MEIAKNEYLSILWTINAHNGHILKELCMHLERYLQLFVSAVFVFANKWSHINCQSTNEFPMKIWYKYNMNYNPDVRIIKFTKFERKWMN